jgi:[ribosomal protein S18]-alanine N-acetyltransferase
MPLTGVTAPVRVPDRWSPRMPSRHARKRLPNIRVRAARRRDLDALLELEQRVFATDRLSRASLRRLLTVPSARVIVADARNRLAGVAVVLFRRGASVARLYSIAVVPQLAGRGVGAALIVAAEAAAFRRRCSCMRLEVHQRNAVAIARYRKSGYRQFGRHAGYYEDGGAALRFEKPLAGSGRRLRR